jgi:hypothetical protein
MIVESMAATSSRPEPARRPHEGLAREALSHDGLEGGIAGNESGHVEPGTIS